MSNKQNKQIKSKRQMMRETHLKKAKRQRIITIGAIVLVGIFVLALIIVPSIQSAVAPAGDFIKVEAQDWPTANGSAIGNRDSSVVVDVFEDFKCSACKKYTETIEPSIIQNHAITGEIYYVIHNYPFLDDGITVKDSDRAAVASLCAAAQNRFWDYHKILYANLNYSPNEFSIKRLTAFADSLGLDMNAFDACLDQKETQEVINADIELGKNLEVTGTPSVYVNGVNIKPGFVPSYEEIKAAIEEVKNSGS
jgi:protein-disulfide isomerase